MPEERERLRQVLEVGQELARIKDLDVLLEKILTEARRFTNAEAGSIYLKEGDRLNFSYTQNEALEGGRPAGRKIIYSTCSLPIDNLSLAGYACATGQVVNIPDAYALPNGLPYRFERHYDDLSGYRTKSVLTFPVKTHRGDAMGVLQLINARDAAGRVIAFEREDEPFVLHFAATAASAVERAMMTRAIIMRMISMARLRDPKETGPHVNRVAAYAVEIYEAWAGLRGMDTETVQRHRDSLRLGAMLHDVGKIAIADSILRKPSRLGPEEVEAMQMHTIYGAMLFEGNFSDFDEASRIIALRHHERWDGTGYPGHVDPATGAPLPGRKGPGGRPLGKRGEEIHPFGRVVAIADVYDALGRRRAYKEAWEEGRVLETMSEEAGAHFDPEMMEAFFSTLEVIRAVAARYPDREDEGDSPPPSA